MDQDQNQNREQPGQEPEPEQKPKRPTTADLYNAWLTGGKAKLMETLPDDPDPDDE